jgi:transposase
MKKRRKYTAEFKREAVQLYLTSGQSLSQVEQNLGIGKGCLGRWKQELEEVGAVAFPGQGNRAETEQARVRELERENEILRQERDILKKAVAIFSRPSQ